MTNREFYKDIIKNWSTDKNGNFCNNFTKPIILKKACDDVECNACILHQIIWLDEEYVESIPKVDWSKVEVDTPIFVRNDEDKSWIPRHFAKFKNGFVCAYECGKTSFTAKSFETFEWKFAKLADKP